AYSTCAARSVTMVGERHSCRLRDESEPTDEIGPTDAFPASSHWLTAGRGGPRPPHPSRRGGCGPHEPRPTLLEQRTVHRVPATNRPARPLVSSGRFRPPGRAIRRRAP